MVASSENVCGVFEQYAKCLFLVTIAGMIYGHDGFDFDGRNDNGRRTDGVNVLDVDRKRRHGHDLWPMFKADGELKRSKATPSMCQEVEF
ncbi:unnamed protein product [Dibothriocephalus latus]|uniref:Uncharacterized protein n=1 Tax=Dibothriocephalus latus TaxID=60516 RepID=A0A3P7NLP0_DIBLA|nr:unnamed protein product [Dibothriocephalus latus]